LVRENAARIVLGIKPCIVKTAVNITSHVDITLTAVCTLVL
jgi:hypothetical protein